MSKKTIETTGCRYDVTVTTKVESTSTEFHISLPNRTDLNEAQTIRLARVIHNALEDIISPAIFISRFQQKFETEEEFISIFKSDK